MLVLSLNRMFKNVPSTIQDMSHQLQKHISDMYSDLVLRQLLARHNWENKKPSWHFLSTCLSDGLAALLSYGHRDSFALKMLTYGSWQDLCTGGLELKIEPEQGEKLRVPLIKCLKVDLHSEV